MRAHLAAILAVLVLGAAPAAPNEVECERLRGLGKGLLKQAERERDPKRVAEHARDAVHQFERAEALCPHDPENPFWTATAHVFAGDVGGYREALARLRKTAGPNEVRIPVIEGHFHYALGRRPDLAVAEFERARAIQPRFMEAQVSVHLWRARLEYAKVLVDQALAMERRVGDNSSSYEGAIAQLRLALRERGPSPASQFYARRNLAQVLRSASQFEASTALWKQLVTEAPKDPVVRYGYATVLADQLKTDEAIVEWEETLRLIETVGRNPADPSDLSDARLRLGRSLALAGRPEDARAQLERYVREQPADARGFYYLGLLYRDDIDDPDKAIEHLERAHALDPLCDETIKDLASLYTLVRPNPTRAKHFQDLLDSPEETERRAKARRERVFQRPDRTEGCR
jgi:tetratricopeptide (TPR) repeat protein